MTIPLTIEVKNTICNHIKEGCPFDTACGLAGIHRATAYNWQKKGREDLNADNHDTIHAQFALAVNKARCEFYQSLITVLKKAAVTEWVPAMTILERRNPTDWGRNNYKAQMDINANGSYQEQFQEVLQQVKSGKISLMEATQYAGILTQAAKAEEISQFRKELDELKALASKKE